MGKTKKVEIKGMTMNFRDWLKIAQRLGVNIDARTVYNRLYRGVDPHTAFFTDKEEKR